MNFLQFIFPKPISLGGRGAWLESEIKLWIAEKKIEVIT
ncbi:helix-turn-helix transcriptional regulator [Photobacterium leiognathi]